MKKQLKITWLGQAGLLFEVDNEKILIDPYLSDSVEKIQPHNKRRVPVDTRFLEIKPTVIILTHDHLDHTDNETLCHYLSKDSEVLVLASENAWKNVRTAFGGIKNNYVLFNCGTTWTHNDITFRAVHAEHSDNKSIGVIIKICKKTYYITGDTLYSERVFADLPKRIDYVFLPINGVGNNMNMLDAKKFCSRIKATAIPLHCGLFDEIDMNSFDYKKKIIPTIYKEFLSGVN